MAKMFVRGGIRNSIPFSVEIIYIVEVLQFVCSFLELCREVSWDVPEILSRSCEFLGRKCLALGHIYLFWDHLLCGTSCFEQLSGCVVSSWEFQLQLYFTISSLVSLLLPVLFLMLCTSQYLELPQYNWGNFRTKYLEEKKLGLWIKGLS